MFKIYMFTSPSGKLYVGLTSKTIAERKTGHKHTAIKENGKYPFSCAIRKYGIENFKLEILEYADTLQLARNLEKYYIKKYKTKVPNGYNLTDGGEGAIGHIKSEEVRRNHSNFMKGRPSPNKGKKASDKTRLLQSLAKKGKPSGKKGKKLEMTPEMHERYSNAHKGQPAWNKGKNLTAEHIEHLKEKHASICRAVKCVETGRIFRHTREAEKITGIPRYTIMRSAEKGGYKVHAMFTFIYI